MPGSAHMEPCAYMSTYWQQSSVHMVCWPHQMGALTAALQEPALL